MDLITKFEHNKFGIFAEYPEFIKEMGQVKKLYQFYKGKKSPFDEDNGDAPVGQDWNTPKNLDYTPTKDIRNLTKKLINRQARFMFGVTPGLSLKPINVIDKDTAEDKRSFIDEILENADFWKQTYTAFLDSTIGKRVLLTVQALPDNSDKPIGIRYYTMPEFMYEVDPTDVTKLTKVTIIYQDERTVGKVASNQLWHVIVYELRGSEQQEQGNNDSGQVSTPQEEQKPHCWYSYKMVDGNNVQVDAEVDTGEVDELTGQPIMQKVSVAEEFDTGLTQLPCYVVLNGGLTGELDGESDVEDLVDLANSYNRTTSDYKDALKFKMFEQPVFIDADSSDLSKVKIAPNAIIDLKTDPALGDGTGASRSASVTTLSSSFSFVQGADSYLDRLTKDMYELMDQPLPEDLKNVPSAKALKFLFYDLIARCEQKWQMWEPAIKWLIGFLEEAVQTLQLYPEKNGATLMAADTVVVLKHNYPIPEDDDLKKQTAIAEVQANVKSHKTYIKEFGDVENETLEWEDIMAEQDEINASSNSGFMDTVNSGLNTDDTKDDNELGSEYDKPTDEDPENDPTKLSNIGSEN